MKKLTVLLFITLSSIVSSAGTVTRYDMLMLDCLDYGHQPASEQKIKACRADVKQIVLSEFNAEMKYLECVDYGHVAISEEREISCLREASEVK